jgi:hypothetical protein
VNDAYAFLDACFGRETFATFAGDFECGIFPIMCVVCHTASWLRVAVEFSQPGLRGNADGQAVLPPGGASLDVDDVAEETNQDWGEGRAPFPENHLPDGGSGGAERVVPDDFGTDWTAEITSSSNRMKKSGRNYMKTTATTEAVSSHPGGKWPWSQQWRRNTSRDAENATGDIAKRLANRLSRTKLSKIAKKTPRRSWATNQMGNPSLLEYFARAGRDRSFPGRKTIHRESHQI